MSDNTSGNVVAEITDEMKRALLLRSARRLVVLLEVGVKSASAYVTVREVALLYQSAVAFYGQEAIDEAQEHIASLRRSE